MELITESDRHRVQIAFRASLWEKILRHGYRGSVTEFTNQMWDERLAKEEGHEISGDEDQLKRLQKDYHDALGKRLKLLKEIDPQCPGERPLRERPVLIRFVRVFIAAGGHLDSPGDIVNHRIKADLSKRVREVESKLDESQKVLSQRLPHFIDFLLAENDIGRFERLIYAPPAAPSKPSLEVGGKNFEEFTKASQSVEPRPVFAPTSGTVDSPVGSKVTAEKPIGSADHMERLRDIMFEGPGGIDFSSSSSRSSSPHPSDKK